MEYIVTELAGSFTTGDGIFLTGEKVTLDQEIGDQFVALGYLENVEAKPAKKGKSD